MSNIIRSIKNYGYLKDELTNVIASTPEVIIDNYAVVGDFIENYLNNAR
jgi:hypothetical protein